MQFELYRSVFRRQWRWRMIAGNNRIVATSGESYHNREDCLYAISLVMNLSPSAPTYEDGKMLSMMDDPLINPPIPSPAMQALVNELSAFELRQNRGQLRAEDKLWDRDVPGVNAPPYKGSKF